MPERPAGQGIGLVECRQRGKCSPEPFVLSVRRRRSLMVLDIPLGAEQTGAVKDAFTATLS